MAHLRHLSSFCALAACLASTSLAMAYPSNDPPSVRVYDSFSNGGGSDYITSATDSLALSRTVNPGPVNITVTQYANGGTIPAIGGSVWADVPAYIGGGDSGHGGTAFANPDQQFWWRVVPKDGVTPASTVPVDLLVSLTASGTAVGSSSRWEVSGYVEASSMIAYYSGFDLINGVPQSGDLLPGSNVYHSDAIPVGAWEKVQLVESVSASTGNWGPTYLGNYVSSWLEGSCNVTSSLNASLNLSGSYGNDYVIEIATVNAVPEPATLGFLALGGLVLIRRRRA